MSKTNTTEKINITVNGAELKAEPNSSIIQAIWSAGVQQVEGVGCLEGVCGSCRVMVRDVESGEVKLALGCQTIAEEGMQINFLNFPSSTKHHYQLDEIKNSWEVQQKFQQVFPEAQRCRSCDGCNKSCPKELEVKQGVHLAATGHFQEAGEKFTECIMCDLCLIACPESIAPNHVGLFSRRVTAYFHTRPSNLINRLNES